MKFASVKRLVVSVPDARLGEKETATKVAIMAGGIFFFAGLLKFAFRTATRAGAPANSTCQGRSRHLGNVSSPIPA